MHERSPIVKRRRPRPDLSDVARRNFSQPFLVVALDAGRNPGGLMSAIGTRNFEGISLRRAAVIAGLAYVFLLNPVVYAEFNLFPKVVIPGNIAQTVQNIDTHGAAFAGIILCYLICFIGDITIAWALYILLAPVNRLLSLLAAWFQVVYATLGLFCVLQLVSAFRLVHNGSYVKAFGASQLQAQVQLAISSFRSGWNFGLILFGIHLVLVGYLIYRSGYIPKVLGILIAIVGLGWIVNALQPFFYPDVNLDWLLIVSSAELLLPLWLLIMGWRIKQPDPAYTSTA
jgi:Domain of unknown function (DUF4386)